MTGREGAMRGAALPFAKRIFVNGDLLFGYAGFCSSVFCSNSRPIVNASHGWSVTGRRGPVSEIFHDEYVSLGAGAYIRDPCA
jgi:hypothetical protein